TPDHRLPGYEDWKSPAEQELETYREAKAIYTALQRMGLSYVKSSMTLGGHPEYSERVRMPQVSLNQTSMNCIDAAVMYSSLFELVGMAANVSVVRRNANEGLLAVPDASERPLTAVPHATRTMVYGASEPPDDVRARVERSVALRQHVHLV